MAKAWNKKQVAKFENKMIETAKNWKANGAKLEQLAENIWRAYGYQTQVKNNKVEIWARHQVIAEI